MRDEVDRIIDRCEVGMRLAVWGGLVAVVVAGLWVNMARHRVEAANNRLCIYDCATKALPSWWPVWALGAAAVVLWGGCFALRAVLLAMPSDPEGDGQGGT